MFSRPPSPPPSSPLSPLLPLPLTPLSLSPPPSEDITMISTQLTGYVIGTEIDCGTRGSTETVTSAGEDALRNYGMLGQDGWLCFWWESAVDCWQVRPSHVTCSPLLEVLGYRQDNSVINTFCHPFLSPSLSLPLPCSHKGMIDVATEWMSDLKEGWCPSAGYYNRESCCWINNETNLDMIEEHCGLWSS